jgi:carboxyl-terminal processing protease
MEEGSSNIFRNNKALNVLLIAFLFWLSSCAARPHVNNSNDPYQQQIDTLRQAYTTILNHRVTAVEPETLLYNALIGFEDFLGKERLSFAREELGIRVISSGQTIWAARSLYLTQGADELAKVFSFIVRMNPQCDARELAHTGVKQMVELDHSSGYLSPAEYKEMQVSTDEPGAVGLEITEKEGTIVVVEPIDESPAMKAGILPDDRLIMIDGRSTKGLSLKEVVGQLKGEAGTQVSLTIERDNYSAPFVFPIIRKQITVKNLRYSLLDSYYAYIDILRFGDKTAFDLDKAMKEITAQSGNNVKGIILDLRNNSGGLLEEPIEVIRRFIQSGLIVTLEGRMSNASVKFYAAKRAYYPYPIVVLVNKATSAGPEIVAGTLQDHKRAIIVGTPSFGHDTIRTVIPLRDGSALMLTTAVWRLPRNVSIKTTGIVPDVVVETPGKKIKDPSDDPVVMTALDILKKK